jgi:flagellar hook-associated protein 1 FlgK
VSFTSILSVARTGLAVHQAAIEVASHNIANAETPGYSRQRATIVPGVPQQLPYGFVGTGATMANVARVRDTLLDASYRREAGSASFHDTSRDLLGAVEGILGEPSEAGLAAGLDAFWSAWSDLANEPTSSVARSVVRQRGAFVASLLNRFDQQLSDAQDQNRIRLGTSIDQLNALATQVADLNGKIVSAEASGKDASDLRDQRDQHVDAMSKFAETRVVEQRNGSVIVLVANSVMVDGIDARQVETMPTSPLRFRMRGDAEPLHQAIGGSIGAITTILEQTAPALRGRLDALARGLVAQVNTVHQTGYVFTPASPTGTAAGAFFHPGDTIPGLPPTLAPVTARTLRLSDAVAQSADNIAASASATGQGNNAVAKSMADFRIAAGSVTYTAPGGSTTTASFAEFYRATVTEIGSAVQAAGHAAESHLTLASQADTRRQSVSGVSTDEELVTLMRHQQAYAAASKLITVADEMMQTLLSVV